MFPQDFLQQQLMTTKSSFGDSSANVKFSGLTHYNTGDLSEGARMYRKEETLKKKLKSMLDLNAGMEHDIKMHENDIKDERASIAFQLHDLTKEMAIKFGCFCNENLQRSAFQGNEASHVVLQSMAGKYQKIQKECAMMRRIFDSLQRIGNGYKSHAKQMQQLVLQQETSNRQYEEQKEKALQKVNEEIKTKKETTKNLENITQQLISDIDTFIEEKGNLQEQENKILARIQQLKNTAGKKQKKVDKIKQWTEIVIDKNNRTIVFKNLKQKKEYLDRLKKKNEQLEIYLCELDNQETMLKKESKGKENKQSDKNKTVNNSNHQPGKLSIKSAEPTL